MVTWKSSQVQDLFAMVKRLDQDADVDDLRKQFVEQLNLTATVPGTLNSSTADGTKLGEDHSVEPFFLIPGTQESSPGKQVKSSGGDVPYGRFIWGRLHCI
jgi:hypothetical protein